MKDRNVKISILSNHRLGLNRSAYRLSPLACDVRLYDNRGTPNMKGCCCHLNLTFFYTPKKVSKFWSVGA
jgi:hypothetical protein